MQAYSHNSLADMQLSGYEYVFPDRRSGVCMTPFPTPLCIKIIRLLKVIPPPIVNFPLPADVESSALFNWLSEAGHTRAHWLPAAEAGPVVWIMKKIDAHVRFVYMLSTADFTDKPIQISIFYPKL